MRTNSKTLNNHSSPIQHEAFNDIRYQRKIFTRLISAFSENDHAIVSKALMVAETYHKNQKRDEGTMYVIHCIRVAVSLMKEFSIMGSDCICAALLHDTLEDTRLTHEQISQDFGEYVLKLVIGETRDKTGETEENRYERKRQKFLETLQADRTARAIKTSDWLDNMRSWKYIADKDIAEVRRQRWMREAETLYIPLAHTVSDEMAQKMQDILSDFKNVIIQIK